ncbi:hypothetical protein [Labrys neptuniae]|uniref:Uncharacterized protein n=1 Tax=Labrys neptuniae TaxID=376174 RepID=A0ABV3PG26_9HYPH
MVRLLLIPVFAMLNHARGGGAWLGVSALLEKLPGRGIFYTSPLAALAAWPALGWLDSLIFGLTYLLWGAPEWGRWYTLNREPRSISGEPGWWAAILERYADQIPIGQIVDPQTGQKRNDFACFTIRNTVLLAPLAFISPWLFLLGPLQTVAYEIGHRIKHPGGVPLCELLFGAVIGTALALVV